MLYEQRKVRLHCIALVIELSDRYNLLDNSWQGWQLEDRTLNQHELAESITNMREVLG